MRLMSWKVFDRLLTPPSTHPAAPAVPSPRRRETSFSLPRRMDSRNSRSLEKELLLRRTWGGTVTCGDMVEAHQGPELEAAYLLLCITRCASLGGSCGTEGTWRWE